MIRLQRPFDRMGRATPRVMLIAILGLLAALTLVAYVILPLLWREHEGPSHPALNSSPKVTHNADGIPGDPLNVGLIGSRGQLVRAMLSAGWRPADPTTFESSVKIAESVLFDRPDPDAPVSNLYVFGRKQDLAFEREVGSSADRRHHVRWWRSNELDANGKPFWIGDATFDVRSGLSHLTGQITHHIDSDVDAQRDQLIADLGKAGQLQRQHQVMGVGPTQDGRNAGGDRYYTDGMLSVGVLMATKTPAETSAPGSERGGLKRKGPPPKQGKNPPFLPLFVVVFPARPAYSWLTQADERPRLSGWMDSATIGETREPVRARRSGSRRLLYLGKFYF